LKTIQQLIDTYLHYLHANFDIEKVEKNIYKIVTPFLDRRNDNIILYAILKNEGKITLTDDSYTLDDLQLSGINFTKKREEELNKILLSYGIFRKNNELFITTDHNSFAQKKHNFIQALISINDMYLLSNEKI